MSKLSKCEKAERRRAYGKGVDDFDSGVKQTKQVNPGYWDGYWDRRLSRRLNPILKKFGLASYPIMGQVYWDD